MAPLVAAILAHALLGVGLAVAIWAVGIGLIDGRASPAHGYAVGLAAAAAVAFLALLSPWLGLVALAALLVAAFRGAAHVVAAARSLVPVVFALPGVVALPVALGVLLHGPTSTEDSSAFGDLLFWAAQVVSSTLDVAPMRDLLLEGHTTTYVEGASTFIAGALAWIPGFDPILFQLATLPAAMLASLCVGVVLAVRSRPSYPLLLATLGIAVIAYPTWLAESPPVSLAVPLGVSLFALWVDAPRLRLALPLVVLLAVDLFLTKIVGLATLAVVVAGALARRGALTPGRAAVAVGAVLLPGVVWVAAARDQLEWLADLFGVKFLPADAVRGIADQFDRRDTQAAAPAFKAVGELLLLYVLARARAWIPLAALAAGIVGTWFVGGHGFDIAVGLGVLLAVLYLATSPRDVERNRVAIAAAGGALALSAWFRDISGVRAALVLLLPLAAVLVVSLARDRGAYAAAVALVAVAALGGVATDALTDRPTTLTTADEELWREVHDVVPEDGLVFTSRTGPRIVGNEGWNYYPGVAERQLYVAGWSNSPLLADEQLRAERLATNRRVLSGDVEPDAVPLDGRYASFYAAVRRTDDVPADFDQVWSNERYVLYEIP